MLAQGEVGATDWSLEAMPVFCPGCKLQGRPDYLYVLINKLTITTYLCTHIFFTIHICIYICVCQFENNIIREKKKKKIGWENLRREKKKGSQIPRTHSPSGRRCRLFQMVLSVATSLFLIGISPPCGGSVAFSHI